MAKKELNKTASWGGKIYERRKGFYSKSGAQEIAKDYRDAGYCATIDKRAPGWFVWVSKEKRKINRGGGGSRKANYENMYQKERGNLKKLSQEYAQLKMPKPKSEISDIRKRRRNYLNKKKLTSTQIKRLKEMDKVLKKVKEVKKKDVLLKMKIKKSKDKMKEIKSKIDDKEVKKI